MFHKSWKLLNEFEYQAYYSKLIGHLNDIPYGPYSALELVVGKDMADSLAKEGEVTAKGIARFKRARHGEDTSSRSAKRRRHT